MENMLARQSTLTLKSKISTAPVVPAYAPIGPVRVIPLEAEKQYSPGFSPSAETLSKSWPDTLALELDHGMRVAAGRCP